MRKQRTTFAAIACALGLLLPAMVGPSQAQPTVPDAFPTLPIHVAVAQLEGRPVVDQAWLDGQVAMANRIFADVGLSFVLADVRTMPERHARLEDRPDRHALGGLMHDDVINWFAVKSLRDVDEPERMRSGVHWRPAGHPGKHFVIVASHSDSEVLPHELGHFFGNRQHPDVAGNIMSYLPTPRGTLPSFDGTQKRRIRRFARRFLQTGELVPVEGR
jgi:hypothetical protein